MGTLTIVCNAGIHERLPLEAQTAMPSQAAYVEGAGCAVLAIVLFGSFAVPIKAPAVMAAGVHPIIYQTYKSLACFAFSLSVLATTDVKFTWWGTAGAAIWVRAPLLQLE